MRGRDIKVDFAPKDKGGYEPLDILFDVSNKAELLISEEEMTQRIKFKGKITLCSVSFSLTKMQSSI